MVKVGHDLGLLLAPCHAPSLTEEDVKYATQLGRERRLHIVNWTEAYNQIPALEARALWDLVIGTSRTDKRRGPKDNPILLNKRRTYIHESGAFKGCGAARPIKIAPERWVTWAVFETTAGLMVLNLCIHPHAGVQNASPFTRRVRGHLRMMKRVEKFVQAKRNEYGSELHVVISGDVNSTAAWDAKYSSASVFQRLGLNVYWHNILAIAADKRLRLMGRPEVIPTNQNGQDHPWFVALYEEK
jgi:hypothetical protein